MSNDMINKKAKILVVDDEEDIIELLKYHLTKHGYDIHTASNGRVAIDVAKDSLPDLIILDIMMPEMGGLEAFKILKKTDGLEETIMVFLSARKEEHMQVTGLDLGADDYIVKPIRPALLQSKIEALLRRNKKKNTILDCHEFSIDMEAFCVIKENKEITLTKKEFNLLTLLAASMGKVILRKDIMKKVWGEDLIVGDRTIDVHIRMLRKKLETDKIMTIKGIGYKLTL
jgi:two-component system alkaline phosphatase synthesis response regulator PhoP